MPHDFYGVQLQEGDIVTLRCQVMHLDANEEACNVSVQALDGPDGEYRPAFTANTRSFAKVADADGSG